MHTYDSLMFFLIIRISLSSARFTVNISLSFFVCFFTSMPKNSFFDSNSDF